jgi:hypothetical protein
MGLVMTIQDHSVGMGFFVNAKQLLANGGRILQSGLQWLREHEFLLLMPYKLT